MLGVEQRESAIPSMKWLFTLGLSKFGLEELENFHHQGLPDQPVMDKLLEIGEEILVNRTVPKIGQQMNLRRSGQTVTIVRYRTDHTTGLALKLREVRWEGDRYV